MTRINKDQRQSSQLRQLALPVPPNACRLLFQKMIMYTINDRLQAVGFSANQLLALDNKLTQAMHLNAFIAVINHEWQFFGNAEIYNPINRYWTKSTTSAESCLSIPNKIYNVKRKVGIDITYLDKYGKQKTGRFVDYEARIIQHEMDHLKGILISDIGKEIKKETK